MRRMVLWLGTAILTFTVGVCASLFWLQNKSASTKQQRSAVTAVPGYLNSHPPLPILAYCELANNPEKYNGQTVRVSTRLSGFIHGILFYDPNCSAAHNRAAVFYNPEHYEEIKRDLKQVRGSDNWFEPVDIIATGKFRKVTPSNESDTIYDRAFLQFEIIQIERASKVH